MFMTAMKLADTPKRISDYLCAEYDIWMPVVGVYSGYVYYPQRRRNKIEKLTFPTWRRLANEEICINYGATTDYLAPIRRKVVNADNHRAVSKRRAFEYFQRAGVPHPPLVDPRDPSSRPCLLRIDGLSGGEGITILRTAEDQVPDPLPPNSFATKLLRKEQEWRVHVWGGRVIGQAQKLLPAGSQEVVRSYDNGARFYTRPECPSLLAQTAIAAVAVLGLDFGAVDLMIRRRTGDPYVFEVNTAPGLDIQSLIQAYAREIIREYRGEYPIS